MELNEQKEKREENQEVIENVDMTKKASQTVKRSFKDELQCLIPSKDYWVMQSLIYLNILIFILMVLTGTDPLDPSGEDLILWGGNLDVLTLGFHEYWRLFTSCFLHIGIVHLLFNMYALLYIGSLLEKVIGHKRFLFAYIVTGLFSSMASCWWNPTVISVGASGAIFGMYGLYLAILVFGKILDKKEQKEMLMSMLIFVGYNLAYGLKENVDNAGHIGGLISGFMIGLFLLPVLSGKNYKNTLLFESVLPLLLLAGMFSFMQTKDISEQMKDYQIEGQEELAELANYLGEIFAFISDVDEKDTENQVAIYESFLQQVDSCHQMAIQFADTHDMNEETTRYLDYMIQFTGLGRDMAVYMLEYIHSDGGEEAFWKVQEVYNKLEKLSTQYR